MKALRPILIVENEADDAFFLERAIKKVGIRNPVYLVKTGEDAVAYLKGEGDFANRIRYPLPMLMLLDLKLSGLDGPGVLKWVRNQATFATLPVIVLSSSNLANDVDEAYRCGANSYVLKTAEPAELDEMLRDFALWWLKHHVSPEFRDTPARRRE